MWPVPFTRFVGLPQILRSGRFYRSLHCGVGLRLAATIADVRISSDFCALPALVAPSESTKLSVEERHRQQLNRIANRVTFVSCPFFPLPFSDCSSPTSQRALHAGTSAGLVPIVCLLVNAQRKRKKGD